jgi:hypothetical protein
MLSVSEMGAAQKTYRNFVLFNTISFNLMTGNVVNLYALRLGADTELIGILAAMSSLNFFFSFFSRHLIYKMGATRLMGTFWSFRYLMMIPLMVTIFPAVRSIPLIPLALITGGTFFFNVSKGIALSAGKPIVGWLAHDNERARFNSGNQTMSFVGSTLANIYIAIMLGKESPLSRYLIIIASGITAGLIASSFIFKLPEPELSTGNQGQLNFIEGVKRGFKKKSFRELMIIMVITNIGSTLTNPFFVVYCKQGIFLSDQTVIILTSIASLGVLFMAYLSKLLMDRVGSKPLFFTFNLLKVLLLLMVIFTPVHWRPLSLTIYMTLVLVFNRMCFNGILSSSDIYFFVTSTPEERVDQGIIFNLVRGLSGLIGSMGGGFILGYLQERFLSSVVPFQIFFMLGLTFHLTALFLVHRLPDVSRFSIKSVLGILISPRDLRAIWYLNRLENSSTPEEEQELLTQISENRSTLTLEELQSRIESPSMFTRLNALNGLRNFPLEDRTEQLLIDQVKTQPYTSGPQAAALLGELNVTRGIPVLRKALDSGDYLLKSRAAVALGRMNDRESLGKIENNLIKGENARIILYSARAIELLKSTRSLPYILEKITPENDHNINDELVLIISGLLDFSSWFFTNYSIYLKDTEEGWFRLGNEIIENDRLYQFYTNVKNEKKSFSLLLNEYYQENIKEIKKDPLLSALIHLKELDEKKEIPYLTLAHMIYRTGQKII